MGAKPFLGEDFLLHTDAARMLFHNYAKDMPIFDYHCHLPVEEVGENRQFKNLTQIWLYGDHYKWRAMRAHGVEERFITGDATDREKFEAWARTVPGTLRNPLYHWTHMELRNPFGVKDLLSPETAGKVYDTCEEMLQQDDFSSRGLLKRMNVKVVCTTDDPVDDLAHHIKMGKEDFGTKVYPAWRPDNGIAIENPTTFNAWVEKLEKSSGVTVKDFDSYLEAIKKRHTFFHEQGCRLSDHGLETMYAEDYTLGEIASIFGKVRSGKTPTGAEVLKFRSCLLYEYAIMDSDKKWVQQYHIGALRGNNTRMGERIGPNTGYDSIGDFEVAKPMSRFFDRLEREDKLAPTIIYNLNPRDNPLLATMIGNFQDGKTPGKMQFGSGWWFLDQKAGMTDQLNTLSNMGLLSRFVGMLTDSRSFLSYPRHEYFRRTLCGLLGEDVQNGELPGDMDMLGKMVKDICWNNAVNYFDMAV